MKKTAVHRVILFVLMLYLLAPLLATVLYAFAGQWQDTLLPETWTWEWFQAMFKDARFYESLSRTLFVSAVTVAGSLLVILPTVFIVVVYFPKLERWLSSVVLLPYALPGVVAAVGLIRVYSSGPIAISGTVWILMGAYFVLILPYMYQGIRNSMRTVHAVELTDAAELLGANKTQAFIKVILPNILPGVVVSTLLSFSILFGEFVLANLLVGGQFPTIQIYLYQRLNESGHMASAIAIAYFILILIISGVLQRLVRSVWRSPHHG